MKLIYVALVTLIGVSNSARILGIFSTPSISHQIVFHTMMKDLAVRGHHLTIVTTDVMKIENPNVTYIDLHDSYDVFKEINFVKMKEAKLDGIDVAYSLLWALFRLFDHQLNHPEVKKLIARKDNLKFDVLIIEQVTFNPMLMFADIYDCPIIGITSLEPAATTYKMYGHDVYAVIHPDTIFSYTYNQITFIERWKIFKAIFSFFRYIQYAIKTNDLIYHHFPSIKAINIEKIQERFQLLMVNSHPAMGHIRPLLPNTIQLGFMHIEPPKPLQNGVLKSFLDKSKNGVIYMSLGTNVQSNDLNPEIMKIFLNVFGTLDYDVLWKFESDNLPNKSSNIMIEKWVPQSDLLAHPAIRLFITQGGQQSMEEAIDRTIPTIVIPFIADQYDNARRVEEKGIGHHLDLHALTQLRLIESINETVKPKYKENVRKLKELVNDQPMTSREKAIWWTEYIIRHKGAHHLQYPGRFVPFYQKYFLDFIAISFVTSAIIVKVVCMILRKCFYSHKIKSE